MKKFGFLRSIKQIFTPLFHSKESSNKKVIIEKAITKEDINEKANSHDAITLGEFILRYADSRQKEGEKSSEGRSGSVRSVLSHLKVEGFDGIPLKQVDKEVCKRIIFYFRHAHDLRHHVKNPRLLACNTIYTKVKTVQAVLQEAVNEGYLEVNPMKHLPSSYKVRREKTRKEFFSDDEIKAMKTSPCDIPQLKEAVLFCCYTAIRKSDLLTLSPKDIQEIDGVYHIHKQMKKTQSWVDIPLSDEAYEILKQLDGGPDSPFFSLLSPHHLNEHVRKWLSEYHISEKYITFHCTRHTCASHLMNLHVDICIISCILGHESLSTTQHYLHGMDDNKVDAMRMLGDKWKVAC